MLEAECVRTGAVRTVGCSLMVLLLEEEELLGDTGWLKIGLW